MEEEEGNRRKSEMHIRRVCLYDTFADWTKQRMTYLGLDHTYVYRHSDADFARHLLEVHRQLCVNPRCSQLRGQSSGIPNSPSHPYPPIPPLAPLRPMPPLAPIKGKTTCKTSKVKEWQENQEPLPQATVLETTVHGSQLPSQMTRSAVTVTSPAQSLRPESASAGTTQSSTKQERSHGQKLVKQGRVVEILDKAQFDALVKEQPGLGSTAKDPQKQPDSPLTRQHNVSEVANPSSAFVDEDDDDGEDCFFSDGSEPARDVPHELGDSAHLAIQQKERDPGKMEHQHGERHRFEGQLLHHKGADMEDASLSEVHVGSDDRQARWEDANENDIAYVCVNEIQGEPVLPDLASNILIPGGQIVVKMEDSDDDYAVSPAVHVAQEVEENAESVRSPPDAERNLFQEINTSSPCDVGSGSELETEGEAETEAKNDGENENGTEADPGAVSTDGESADEYSWDEIVGHETKSDLGLLASLDSQTCSSSSSTQITSGGKGFGSQCPFCNFSSTHSAGMHEHLQTHVPRGVSESERNKAIKAMRRFVSSRKEWSHRDFGWCQECEKVFLEVSAHKRFAHEMTSILCPTCGKLMKRRCFKLHEITHLCVDEKDMVKCPHCPATFKHRQYVVRHVRHVHMQLEKRHVCETCGMAFLKGASLRRHLRIHANEKPFRCEVCDRRFTQVNNLRAHMRQHTGQKPYACEFCSAAFTNNVTLKIHRKKLHGVDWWKMNKFNQEPDLQVSSAKEDD